MRVAHEAADRQSHEREHLAVRHGHLATAALHERAGGKRHVLVVVAHDEQVVRVVAHGLRERAMDAKARAEAKGVHALLAVVTVEHGHLEDVCLGVCLELAVAHRHLDDAVPRDGGATHAADGAHAGKAVRAVDAYLEVRRREAATHVHRARHEVGPRKQGVLEQGLPVLGHEVSIDEDLFGHKACEVGQNHEVGALAGRDAAHVGVDAKHLGGVYRGELQRRHGVCAGCHARAQRAVHAALGDERVGVVVVRAQADEARVHTRGEHLRQVARKREPGGSVAGLDVHAHAELGDDVLWRDGLVAGTHARGDIGGKPAVRLRDGVVARDALACLEGLGYLVQGVLLAGEDAGEVHHLAETHDVGPFHGGCHLGGVYGGAGVVKSRDGRHAGGRREHGLERRAAGVIEHDSDALEPHDVGALVRVRVDGRGAARHDDARVLGRADHGALDVDVRVDVAGRYVLAGSVDDTGLGPDAVLGRVAVKAQVGDAPAGDGDVGIR